MKWVGYRVLVIVIAAAMLVPVRATQTNAEEMIEVRTEWHPLEAHPVYIIAMPSQAKLSPRPLDIPIVFPRSTSTDTPSQLPFAMNAAQAVKIGNGLIDDGDFPTALAYFEEARKQDSSSLDVLTGLAHCYYELKRDDEALAIYKEVVSQNANIWQVQFILGRIYLEHKRYAEAVEAFTIARKLEPDDPDTISGLGIALTKSGRQAEAIPLLTQITALKRYKPEDYYNLGEAHAVDQQWLKAAEAFKMGADIRGIDPNGYFYWATMLFYADKLDEAFEGYQKVKKLDLAQKHVGVSQYLADIYRLRGKTLDALTHYSFVLRLQPDDVEALVQAGYIHFKFNQLGQAKDSFRNLLKINPTHAVAGANLAALEAQYNEKLQRTNQPTPGITLRETIRANPDSLEAHVNLGAQLITEKVYGEAVTVLQRAVTLKSDSAAAQYNLGLAQLKSGNYQDAVNSFGKALALKRDWPDAYNNLGRSLAGLNRWEEAASAYNEAVRLIPNYAGAYHNLGVAYVRLGRLAQAKDLVEKLKPMSWDLQARLAHEILEVERPGVLALASPTPAPVSQPTPVPAPTVEPEPTNGECPGPIYKPDEVTQMPSLTGELHTLYSEEAFRNKTEGKIVLQLVLCSNGRVSDITIQERLPYGLTERTIEVMKTAQFQPALLDTKPVSVRIRQVFNCAQSMCTAIR